MAYKYDNNVHIVDRTTFEQTICELTDKFRSAVNFYVSHRIEKINNTYVGIIFKSQPSRWSKK